MQILAIRERLRQGLPALSAELAGLATLHSQHPGSDGSIRLLVELADGQAVESVLLPRDGLCVSTQVGRMTKAPNCSPRQHAAPNQRS